MNDRQKNMFRNGDIVVIHPNFKAHIKRALESSTGNEIELGYTYFYRAHLESMLDNQAFIATKRGWKVDLMPVTAEGDNALINGIHFANILPIGGYRDMAVNGSIKIGDYVTDSSRYRSYYQPSDVRRIKAVSKVIGVASASIIGEDMIATNQGIFPAHQVHKLSAIDMRRLGDDLDHILDINYCAQCSSTNPTNKIEVGGETLNLCDTCVSERIVVCAGCEGNMLRGRTSLYQLDHSSDEYFCNSCYSDYPACERCGDRFEEDDLNEDGLCSECKYNGAIRHYNYRPSNPSFFKAKGTNPSYYFGLELEVLCSDASHNAYDLRHNAPEDLIYFKSDGSIRGEGFEMVTNPFSWDYYKKAKGDFMAILQELRDMEANPHESCGIHIHISRTAFKSQRHLYSFLRLITAENNRRFTKKIAGRSTDDWASLSNQGDHEDIINKAKHKNSTTDMGRYTAVNMENSATVEVRIFKATLDDLEFFKNIEYVRAMVDYTRHMPIKEAVNALGFVGYVLDSKEYPAFREWLIKESNIIPRGIRAMIEAMDEDKGKRRKNTNSRSLKWRARQIMSEYDSPSKSASLYQSIGHDSAGDGIPEVVNELRNTLQNRIQNSI